MIAFQGVHPLRLEGQRAVVCHVGQQLLHSSAMLWSVSLSSKLRQSTQRAERTEREEQPKAGPIVRTIPRSDLISIHRARSIFIAAPDHLIELPGTPPPVLV
jgi:hypothetical protein